jgi:hypothetical protein
VDHARPSAARGTIVARVAAVCAVALAATLFLISLLARGREVAARFQVPPPGGIPVELTVAVLLLLLAVAGRYAAHRPERSR